MEFGKQFHHDRFFETVSIEALQHDILTYFSPFNQLSFQEADILL